MRLGSTQARATGAAAAISIAMVMALAGCGANGPAFRQSDEVDVIAPESHSVVSLPVTVRWRTGPMPAGRRFAVFVDRTPMPPGRDLAWLARGDDECQLSGSCPDEAWLNARGIYTTTAREATVPTLSNATGGRRTPSNDSHRLVVVVLDSNGQRVGEQAFARSFRVAEAADR